MKHATTSSPSRKQLDRQALEQRRKKAIKWHNQGKSQYFIAKKLSVSFEAVSNWVEIYQKKGLAGLASKGKPGPKPRLTAADRKKIKAAILKGPRAAGYETDLWTLGRLKTLIAKESKERFHPGHVWKIVCSLGFSCQKPETRARERDEQAIQAWREKTVPRLKKMGG